MTVDSSGVAHLRWAHPEPETRVLAAVPHPPLPGRVQRRRSPARLVRGNAGPAWRLRFLAQHPWVYRLAIKPEQSGDAFTFAYLLTHVRQDDRVLLYRGVLRDFALARDGRFSYVVLTGPQRGYLRRGYRERGIRAAALQGDAEDQGRSQGGPGLHRRPGARSPRAG